MSDTSRINSGASATTVKHKIRLSVEEYRVLESRCPSPDVNNDTSQIAAGMRLGVQLVLKLLREGFVVGE